MKPYYVPVREDIEMFILPGFIFPSSPAFANMPLPLLELYCDLSGLASKLAVPNVLPSN